MFDETQNKIINATMNLIMEKLKSAVWQVEKELTDCSQGEREKEALRRADLLKYYGNPLVKKSLEACKEL